MTNKIAAFGFIIVGVFAILFAIGLFSGILNSKSSYLKLYGGILTALALVLTAIIGFVFDSASTLKSDSILSNTETTKNQVTVLDEKTETSIGKLENLKQSNIDLQDKVLELQNSQIEKNNQILDLGQKLKVVTLENNVIVNENLNLSNKIKYPLPENIDLSCKFTFKLSSSEQLEVDKILVNEDISSDEKTFSLLRPEIAFRILMMRFSTSIRLVFSKNIQISKEKAFFKAPTILHLMGNIEITKPQFVAVNYNQFSKTFVVSCHKVQLQRESGYKFDNTLASNLNSFSIHDLENSMFVINHATINIENIKIEDVYLKSKELNLNFKGSIPRSEHKDIFICSTNLKLKE
jgi:hypothetical protein